MARDYWVSPKSWIVTTRGFAARVREIDGIQGVAGGIVRSSPVECHTNAGRERMMFEVFTTGGYAVIDHDARVVTTGGVMTAKEIVDVASSGEGLFLELYLGQVAVQRRALAPVVGAPHCTYLPRRVTRKVLDRLLVADTREVVIARAAFPYAYWIICKLVREGYDNLSVSVDNHTFPSEMVFDVRPGGGDNASARILAITRFVEQDPLRLEVHQSGVYPCCDGILLA